MVKPLYSFHVKGSAAEPYVIEIFKKGRNLSATCTCPAGRFRSICKHRLAIMTGDATAVVSGNAADVAAVVQAIDGTDVHAAMTALTQAEKHMAEAKSQVDKAKKALVVAMED
jgi:uncharacterized Zn finger protein